MGNTILQLKKITASKNLHEMFENISWSMIEKIAFIPVISFIISPVIQLILSLSISYYYSFTIETINLISGVSGIIAIIMYMGKKSVEKYSFKEFVKENTSMIFFSIMIILMLISTFINGFTDYALHGTSYRNESLFTFIMYFTIYFFCSSMIKSQKLKLISMYTYISGTLILGIFALVHQFLEPISQFIHYIDQKTLSIIFEQFNHYGYYLLIGILISSSLFILEKNKKLKIFCMVSFLVNNAILIINDTFGCYLACFIGLVFTVIVLYIIERKINKSAVFILICFIALSLVMQIWYDSISNNIYTFFADIFKIAVEKDNAGGAGTGRWTLWIHTVDYIKEKPIFGFGVEGIYDRLFEDTNNNNRPHNEFLQYAAFFGIPSAVIYVCGIFSAFLKGLKYKMKLDKYTLTSLIAAFGYLVSSVFGNTMYYTTAFLFIFLGMGIIKNEKNSN